MSQLAFPYTGVDMDAPLRPDLERWHCARCDCQRPTGSPRCGSCPFAVAQPGRRRPSNKALGLGDRVTA